ncbi:MAG: PEP-CTERM/exosortase system-associated acyltransferase [Gammaproteobacteria bacterium]
MSLTDNSNLGSGFRGYFRIDAALDDELYDEVLRIRHDVYCVDLGFERVREDARESDAYDTHSIHCLLRTATKPHHGVGCARVVLTDPDDRAAPLPFERTCAGVLDRSIIDPARLPRERIAEVSRLAVCRAYRRRKGEEHSYVNNIEDDNFDSQGRPRFPYIPVSLYMGAIAIAAHHGIDTLFVLTEPRLASHFAKLGVRVTQIGGAVEHRGTRVPSMIDVQDVIRNMRLVMRPLWREVVSEIERSYKTERSHDITAASR